MTKLLRIADRLLDRPLLIHPGKVPVILSVLRGRLLPDAELNAPKPEASEFTAPRKYDPRTGVPEMLRVESGVAHISVIGSLVNRGAWLDSSSGLTSYEGIVAQVKAAAADKSVKAMLLDIDSFGGEAGGMFALAQAIRSARKSKPVIAVVDDNAYSGGYGIASAATEIVVSPTSGLGSIGVVCVHADYSKMLEAEGVVPTLIFAGAHKVDGNPFEPLPEPVRKDIQREIDAIYARFIETVYKGRGTKLSAEQARATEAQTYIGQEAIDAGLADRIGTFDQVVKELTGSKPRPSSKPQGGNDMEQETITTAEHQRLVTAATEKAKAEGVAEGDKNACGRYSAMLALEEAKGREAHVGALFASGMSVEQAKVALATMPKSTSLAGRASGAPDLGHTDPEAGAQRPQAQAMWDKAIKSHNDRVSPVAN